MPPTPSRRTVLIAAALAPLAALPACTGFLTGKPPTLYTVDAAHVPQAGPPVRWQLTVEEPSASSALDTDYIALMPANRQYEYFKASRWAARAPAMIQGVIVESFENSGRILSVGRQSIGLRSDYGLSTELRDFQAEYAGDMARLPRVHVGLTAKMIDQLSLTITSARSFEAYADAAGPQVDDVVAAFDAATQSLVGQLIPWVLSQPAPAHG